MLSVGATCCCRRLRQTRAKWPVLLQLQHIAWYAGQFWRPPWWCPAPHPGDMLDGLCEVTREVFWTAWMCEFATKVLVISARCCFAASRARQLVLLCNNYDTFYEVWCHIEQCFSNVSGIISNLLYWAFLSYQRYKNNSIIKGTMTRRVFSKAQNLQTS